MFTIFRAAYLPGWTVPESVLRAAG